MRALEHPEVMTDPSEAKTGVKQGLLRKEEKKTKTVRDENVREKM